MVVFGPDHVRNFFFDVMPSFCVGVGRVEGFGDYSSPGGELPSDPVLGQAVVEGAHERGFDAAFSLRMGVDHGITQAYAALDPSLTTPLAPIMINCAGGPLPSLRRCYEFGRAVGAAIRNAPGEGDVLVVGSGGLSHWPPSVSPYEPSLNPETRDYVISGRDRAREFNAEREAMSRTRREKGGEGPVNELWDSWFLECLRSGDIEPVLALSADELLAAAGTGGQEVRTWLAAYGAWGGPVGAVDYEPVPKWITGMGCITGFADQSRTT